jgi:hypothetical protein
MFKRFVTRVFKPPKERLELHNGLKFVQQYPCSILKGRLYLGDANHAQQKYVIKNMRISHIVNVTDCIENVFDNDDENINYL